MSQSGRLRLSGVDGSLLVIVQIETLGEFFDEHPNNVEFVIIIRQTAMPIETAHH